MSQHSRNVVFSDLPVVDVFEFEGRQVAFCCPDLRRCIIGAGLLTKHSLPLNVAVEQEGGLTNVVDSGSSILESAG